MHQLLCLQKVRVLSFQLGLAAVMLSKSALSFRVVRVAPAAVATAAALLAHHADKHLLILEDFLLQLDERLVDWIVTPCVVGGLVLAAEVVLGNDHVEGLLCELILQNAVLLGTRSEALRLGLLCGP